MGTDAGLSRRLTSWPETGRLAAVKSEKRVLHLDMDAFFAALEQRDNPLLRGKPVIVGGPPGGRGVVSTCSYEARKYGIHSAMPISKVKQLCPHAIFVPLNGRKYAHASRKIMAVLHKFSPQVQQISVDEAFMDLTGLHRLYRSEEELARKIKQAVYEEVGVTCSVGIAPTKILAKLASGMEKPDGLTILTKEELASRVYPLPVSDLWGIGEATEKALARMGVKTIGDLANFPEVVLKKVFGKNGPDLARAARGELDSPVLTLEELPQEKSIGNEHTFWEDTDHIDQIFAQLLLLAQQVGRRLRKKGLKGRTITLKLRYDNFETHTHRTTLDQYTANDTVIYSVARQLFYHLYEANRKVRLLGISVSRLTDQATAQLALPFDEELSRQKIEEKLLPTVDNIKDVYGEQAIWRASSFQILKDWV